MNESQKMIWTITIVGLIVGGMTGFAISTAIFHLPPACTCPEPAP